MLETTIVICAIFIIKAIENTSKPKPDWQHDWEAKVALGNRWTPVASLNENDLDKKKADLKKFADSL